MKQTFAIADSSLSRRPNINIRPKTGQANSSCCHPEQAIFNSDITLYAADNTVRAWAVKAWSREPISAMLPDKTIFISASRSRKIGAVNLFVSTDTFSEAAAKPFLPISKGITKAIPATTSSFFTLNFKARQTGAVNQWVWAPSLINFENITMFVFTAWKQILSKSVLRARREGNLQQVSRSIFEGKIAESKFNDIQCFIVRRRKERDKKGERFQTVPGTPAKSFKCMCVSTGPSYHQNQFWAVVEKWWVPKNSRMIKLKPQTQLLCYQLLMFIGLNSDVCRMIWVWSKQSALNVCFYTLWHTCFSNSTVSQTAKRLRCRKFTKVVHHEITTIPDSNFAVPEAAVIIVRKANHTFHYPFFHSRMFAV